MRLKRSSTSALRAGSGARYALLALCLLLALWYVSQVQRYVGAAAGVAAAPSGLASRAARAGQRRATPRPPPRARAAADDDFADAAEMAALLDADPASVSTAQRRRAVAGMMCHAWDGYARYAMGKDELAPVSRSHRDWLHLGLTAVDALDTLLLMRLPGRAAAARAWVANALDVAPDKDVNLFETSIRILGGLLSAHHLTPGGDAALVLKARALGDTLNKAFATPTGIPFSDVNLRSGAAHGPAWSPDSSVAEVSSLRLEFQALADAVGVPALVAPAAKAQLAVAALAARSDGLVASKFISPTSGGWGGGRVMTLGSRVDSYYEYLLKAWLQTGKRDGALLRAYQDAVHGITTRLLRRSRSERLLFVAELHDEATYSGQFDHLVCFYPGVLALGHMHGVRPAAAHADAQRDALVSLGFPPNATQLDVAAALTATCREMYARNPLRMGPEIAHFNLDNGQAEDDLLIKPADAHSLLRPEYVESLFVLWRATRDARYREWGWDAWRGIERHARVPTGGYASLDSVLAAPPRQRDSMESFFLGETLKYLYLLFEDDPDVIDLTQWVFNTEAHPLPIRALGG